MKKFITIVIVIAVIGVIINDVSRFATAKRHLGDATYELARWAADRVPTTSREDIAAVINTEAAPLGVKVYQYDQTENKAKVWTSSEVEDTVILGTIVNLTEGMSFEKARKSPWVITHYQEAGI